jgi:hypothetical protein
MGEPLFILFLSLGAIFALTFLFSLERKRGRRLFAFTREHIDYWLLKIGHAFLKFYRGTGRNVVRQIAHYFFHTMLMGVLAFLERGEKRVKHLMRSNKTLAKKSEREGATRNKLEEIALHKMEVALSDEEKRRHREKSLHG